MCVMMIVGQEVLANEKAQSSNHVNEEVDLDELMDVSANLSSSCLRFMLLSLTVRLSHCSVEKLHADRIAALKVTTLATPFSL